MSLQPGTQLGPYEVVAKVGEGGMGAVYRARDTRLDRDVAIKVSTTEFSERFSREARSIAALNHPNVCHLYDVGPNYLVLEYVEGETLHGPMSLDEALPIIRQLIDGIEAAHEKNIIHRDLKTANGSFAPDGRLVFSHAGTIGLPDVWTIPVDLSDPERPIPGKPEPLLTEAHVEVDPTFSPDGKFVAYASSESGQEEVFVRAYPGPGGKWKVSSQGGKFPAWARGTREIFFLGGDDRIMVASYTTKGNAFSADRPRQWSPTQVLRTGTLQNFDVSPDGKRVVVFPRRLKEKGEGSLHVTVLLNFFDELRRRIP